MTIDPWESVNMAARTLSANKLRSGLTMLGIIIGNAAVITMVSVGLGTQRYISQEFKALGTNLLFVIPGSRGSRWAAVRPKTLVLADAEAIAREVPAVVAVAPEKSARLRVSRGNQETQVTVSGTTPEYQFVRNSTVAKGQFFGILDLQANNRVAVLGSDTASTLFGGQNPIGEKIRIRNLSFRIIGVMKAKGATMGRNRDEAVFVPITVMVNQLTGRETSRNSPTVNSIAVSARNPESANAALYQITNLLRLRHNIIRGENDFTVRNQQDLLQSANNITNVLILMLGATAAVSLLVGGIGIMNIMLVSVTERTQEIGLRKAMGATRGDILAQFTIEAVILATVGGLFGIVFGVGGTLLVAVFSPLEAILSPMSIVLAVCVSSAIGLIFGVFPARSAALLDPIVALRGN